MLSASARLLLPLLLLRRGARPSLPRLRVMTWMLLALFLLQSGTVAHFAIVIWSERASFSMAATAMDVHAMYILASGRVSDYRTHA